MTSPEVEKIQKRLLIGRVFTPNAPIDEASLFSGRVPQLQSVVDAINQRGQHAVIHGERGVGKTSFTNVLKSFLNTPGISVLVARATADKNDNYSTLWRKVFGEIPYQSETKTAGFSPQSSIISQRISDVLPDTIEPNMVRRLVTDLGANGLFVIVIDEFDRLAPEVSVMMADTVKSLSDHASPVTLILVGVADSVNQLIEDHASVERCLLQIHMPRMSDQEIREVVNNGLKILNMEIDPTALDRIVLLSQGLPHFTHLISQHAATHSNDNDRSTIIIEDIEYAVGKSVENAQLSIRTLYNKAVSSPRPDNLYSQVLLACALAEHDDLGYFQTTSVREPMSQLMGKRYEIPSFAKHLKDFCDADRGPILERIGPERRFRYRFINPLVQPYVIMRGISDGRLSRERLTSYYETGH